MCAHFTHDWHNQHPPICINASLNWPCNCLQCKGHIFILDAFFPSWLANISKPHLCVAVSAGPWQSCAQQSCGWMHPVLELQELWGYSLSAHVLFFFFPTMSVETRCSTCPTWFYSLFTFLNLLLLEHCKWGPPFFPVLDKPLLGRCHSNWDQRWSPAYPPPHTLWSRGVACSSANDNYWYDGFTRHCGPSPWGGTKQPNDRLLSLY